MARTLQSTKARADEAGLVMVDEIRGQEMATAKAVAVQGALEVHPAAELFPLLTGKEFEAFKADIAERGLIEPIWLCDGKILDGRNRYRACVDVGVEPTFAEYEGDSPTAFAWSLNGQRRHLSKSQLAGIAADMLPALQAEAKKRQLSTLKRGDQAPVPLNLEERETGEAASEAAEIVGVDKSYVYAANRIKKADPDLHEDVKAGKVSVDKATKIITGKDEPAGRNQPREQRAADITRLAAEGNRAAQIAKELGIGVQQVRNIARDCNIELPDAKIGKTREVKTRRVIEQTVSGLEGYALGLQTINGATLEVDSAEATEWAQSLKESIKPINRLIRQLTEIANGKA